MGKYYGDGMRRRVFSIGDGVGWLSIELGVGVVWSEAT